PNPLTEGGPAMADARRLLRSLPHTLRTMVETRPRETFVAACLAALLAGWLVTVFMADRLLSEIPRQTAPREPRPLTQDEIQAQIREAQEINRRILEGRAAARAYAEARAHEADSARTAR